MSTSTTGPPARERLLEAGADLFYREGVNVGIELLCRTAHVSKRSMYQMFRTKDEVIAESLAHRAPWYAALFQPEGEDGSPRERILAVFERLEAATQDESYLGCPFISTAVELKDPDHPASVIARRYKQQLTDYFETEASKGGVKDSSSLADQLTIVFDGANARAVVRAEPLTGVAVTMATALLDAAGLA
ncbi:TetR/AcrR family transcriptional regulator [Kribbella deserti]|uniref:TetR/AcrR family transcriptional regulator n=1 Tax=Kribbella deserti TaxID=1926257 RepID=A0ABV6QRC3_9ACTN